MSGEKLSKEARARLDAMCQTNDGFRLAELDLKLRGAGDIAGTQQSGMAFDLKIANPTLDVQILQLTRDAAGRGARRRCGARGARARRIARTETTLFGREVDRFLDDLLTPRK